MRNLLRFITLVLFVGSCSSSQFESKAQVAKTRDYAQTEGLENPENSSGKEAIPGAGQEPLPVPPDPSPVPDLGGNIGSAVMPVPISGAPLTCIRSAEAAAEVRCTFQEEDGTPSDVNPSFGFIISGQDPSRTPVKLSRESVGIFTFNIPSELSSLTAFGVGLADTDENIQMALVGDGRPDLTNLVKNSSFEDYIIPLDTDVFMVPQGEFKNWFGRYKDQTACLDISPIMKIQKTGVDLTAFEGKQWAELETVCAEDRSRLGGNAAFFQDLTVLKDHAYAIAFAYRRSGPKALLQKFALRWNADLLLEKEVADERWTWNYLIKSATTDRIRLDFEEIGIADGFGTLIDDVRVYDLGLSILP